MGHKLIISIMLSLFSVLAFAQESFTITTATKISGLPAEYESLGEQKTITQIKGEKSRVEVTSLMGTQLIVFDGKIQTSLYEAMGNKTGFTATTEELEAASADDKSDKPKIEYTTEKKDILGYECVKAIITSVAKDKKENTMIAWVTDKIRLDRQSKNTGSSEMMGLSSLAGYPLEIETTSIQGSIVMKIVINATEITTSPIDDSVLI